MGVPHHDFELALQSVKDARGVRQDTDLDVDDLKKVVALYSELYHRHVGAGSRPTPGFSSSIRSTPCSVPGTTPGPYATASSTTSKG